MRNKMQIIMIVIYVIELILIVISIINLVRASKYLNIRNQNLKELIETKEDNQKLSFKNYEYQDILNKIYKIVFENSQGSIVDRFDKIKEVIQSAKRNNLF